MDTNYYFGEGETTPSTEVTTVDTSKIMTQPMTPEESFALFTQASKIAQSSVDTTLNKAASLASSAEVQQFIKDNGLEPYLRDVTQDRVKTILSMFGLWYITKLFRSKGALYAAGGLGVYILFLNRDKLTGKIASKVSA